MKRLTRKIKGANNYCEFELKDQPYKSFLDIKRNSDLEWLDVCDLTLAIDKLGQLEDIEKELGIDLITLFKAISNEKGIWKKVYGTKDFVNTRAMLTCEFGKWRIYDKEWIYELKDYGKTWWLEKPKEELENG